MADVSGKDEFLNPVARYQGEFSPQNLAFDANLQEFANRVTLICALENGGKITSIEAYHQIKDLWEQLRASKRNLLDLPPQDS